MNISIFGLGYVGCVSLGCLSRMGYRVIGVDINEQKNNLINSGIPTIIEKDIDIIIKQGKEAGLISATSNVSEAVLNSEISFICVGTPNDKNGHLNLSQLIKASKDIGTSLRKKDDYHVIVIRSTVLPGTADKIINIIEENSNKIDNKDFCVIVNPEFLREGNAVDDYFNPSVTVIGGSDKKGIEVLMDIYKSLPGEQIISEIAVAESIKLLNNSFHALKVAFINEIGSITKTLGINTHQLIDIFLLDTKLNISPAYLRPGFAYGGSCLPKDLKALNLIAHDAYINTPVLNSIEKSNDLQINRAVKLIEEHCVKNVSFWGISFKEGTDDLRSSPVIKVIEQLLGKGYEISLFDENVNQSQLTGANKEFIEKVLPHFRSIILDDFDSFIKSSELLVVSIRGGEKQYKKILEKESIKILDLRDIRELQIHKNYQGFNW